MLEVGSENFEDEVIKSDSTVVVDFWGPQCGPCLALMPQVEELARKYAGQAKVVKLDSSKNRRLCISLKVISLPTFLFYKGGQEVGRLTGNDLSIQAIEETLEQAMQN
ncbi:MAG: thioredoxin [Firmicutes bacterium]|nr:thioredoxin [Bacillota bacterium]